MKLQELFNEYRDMHHKIEQKKAQEQQIRKSKKDIGLTLGQQLFPSLSKRLSPEKAVDIDTGKALDNHAGSVHIDIIQRETKAAEIGIQLPVLFTLRPEQIREISRIEQHIRNLIPTIRTHINQTQNLLNKLKTTTKRGILAEAGEIIIESKAKQISGNPLWETAASLLSTRISTQGMNTTDINNQIRSLKHMQTDLEDLQKDLTQLNKAISSSQSGPTIRTIPNLSIIEYLDLITDILHQGKDIGSIISIGAQGYTYVRIGNLINKLNQTDIYLQKLDQELIQMRDDIGQYRTFHGAYRPPTP